MAVVQTQPGAVVTGSLGHKILREHPASSRELARLTGCSRAAIDAWRSGKTTPRDAQRTRLAVAGIVQPSAWDRPQDSTDANVADVADTANLALESDAPIAALEDVLSAVTKARKSTGLSADALARLALAESTLIARVATERRASAGPTRDEALELARREAKAARGVNELIWLLLTCFPHIADTIGLLVTGTLVGNWAATSADTAERRREHDLDRFVADARKAAERVTDSDSIAELRDLCERIDTSPDADGEAQIAMVAAFLVAKRRAHAELCRGRTKTGVARATT